VPRLDYDAEYRRLTTKLRAAGLPGVQVVSSYHHPAGAPLFRRGPWRPNLRSEKTTFTIALGEGTPNTGIDRLLGSQDHVPCAVVDIEFSEDGRRVEDADWSPMRFPGALPLHGHHRHLASRLCQTIIGWPRADFAFITAPSTIGRGGGGVRG
jgi:hypothetical protein